MRTPLGMPQLTQKTVDNFVKRRKQAELSDQLDKFELYTMSKIQQYDQLFRQFIKETALLYSYEHYFEAQNSLLMAHTILADEGDVPQLHQKVYQRHQNNLTFRDPFLARMARMFKTASEARAVLMNDAFTQTYRLVKADNPVFADYIQSVFNAQTEFNVGVHLRVDLANAYLLLADSRTPEIQPAPAHTPYSVD